MADVSREKYMKIMGEIEELEEQVDELQKKCDAAPAGGEDGLNEALQAAREKLESLNRELQRVSDGCGRPQAR
jgi:predicted  nucleic acid-binding Zn-ribbon protein